LTLSIKINEANYHNLNQSNQNILSKELSTHYNSSIRNQSDFINHTSNKKVSDFSIYKIKTNETEEWPLKYRTLQEALKGLEGFQYEDEGESWECTTCYYVVRMMSNYVYYGGNLNGTIEKTLHNICSMVVDYDPDTFCTGIISQKE
ncbi:unnamed protein product, partial [Meganyctiphanes norvegica]